MPKLTWQQMNRFWTQVQEATGIAPDMEPTGVMVSITCPHCRIGIVNYAPRNIDGVSKCSSCGKAQTLWEIAAYVSAKRRQAKQDEAADRRQVGLQAAMGHDSYRRVGGAIRRRKNG